MQILGYKRQFKYYYNFIEYRSQEAAIRGWRIFPSIQIRLPGFKIYKMARLKYIKILKVIKIKSMTAQRNKRLGIFMERTKRIRKNIKKLIFALPSSSYCYCHASSFSNLKLLCLKGFRNRKRSLPHFLRFLTI